MSQQFTGQVIADLAPAVEAIQAAAKRLAEQRAQAIAQVPAGAVQTTAEQLAAIEAKAAEELFGQLAEELRDVTRVFITTVNKE